MDMNENEMKMIFLPNLLSMAKYGKRNIDIGIYRIHEL